MSEMTINVEPDEYSPGTALAHANPVAQRDRPLDAGAPGRPLASSVVHGPLPGQSELAIPKLPRFSFGGKSQGESDHGDAGCPS